MQGQKAKLHLSDLQQTRIKRDQEAVSAVVHLIQGWVNPFAEKQVLISISTARTAPRDIASDLMKAHEMLFCIQVSVARFGSTNKEVS